MDEYQQVREQIARIVMPAGDELWDLIPEERQGDYLKQADAILSLPDILIKSDDQSVPEQKFPYSKEDNKVYKQGQKSMVGFIKAFHTEGVEDFHAKDVK
jgi:hypothetical protein